MKTEVYSWRVSADLKTSLAQAAHRQNQSLSSVLETAAREWLGKGQGSADDGDEQLRLHAAAFECIGTIAGRNPNRSENARRLVRARLRRK